MCFSFVYKGSCVYHTSTVRLILIKSWLTKTILTTLVHGVICVTRWMMKNKCCGETSHFLILKAMIPLYCVTNSDINHCAISLDPWDSHQPICQVSNLKMLYTVFTNTNNPSLHFLELTDEWWKQWVVGKYIGICLLHVTIWIETLTRLLRLQTSYNVSFNRKHALFEW